MTDTKRKAFRDIIEALRDGSLSKEVAKYKLAALRKPTQKPHAKRTVSNDIAVIGLACEAPSAPDANAYWKILCGEQAPGSNRRLTTSDEFDGLFFRIAPREAASMSSHQKLVLENAWRALEDACVLPQQLTGENVSIYVGAEPSSPDFQASFTGSSDAIVASRLSYYLDLRGPSLVVNTGCSSSASAIHLACEALRTNRCAMALAGGVYANLNEDVASTLSNVGMVSPSGQCRAFDAAADGTVLCEGVGMVVLKRLADAQRDGDPVHGIICASATNQDGASNGITAPNGAALTKLFQDTYRHAEIDPTRITYIEAHGTGTPLGDPVEANALARAFKTFTTRQHFCQIGSAKAAIGHASAAAGVLGLIKLLLCFRHQHLPGMLQFKDLNCEIDFSDAAFRINAEPQDWVNDDGGSRLAALNSFGHSGTNVHMVVESPPPVLEQKMAHPRGFVALPLSADRPEGLRAALVGLRDYLLSEPRTAGISVDNVKQKLGEILNVPPDQVEETEALEDLGITPEDRLRLVKALDLSGNAHARILDVRCLGDLAQKSAARPGELQHIAHTLQHHRQSRKERICLLVQGTDELLEIINAAVSTEGAVQSVLPAAAPDALRNLAEAWLTGSAPDWPSPKVGIQPLHLPVFTYARTTPKAKILVDSKPEHDPKTEDEPSEGTGAIPFAPRWRALDHSTLHRAKPERLLLIGQNNDPRLSAFESALAHVVRVAPSKLTATDFDDHTDICYLSPVSQNRRNCLLELLGVLQTACSASHPLTRLCWTFVTTCAFAMSSKSEIDPTQAALHGVIGVLAKEQTAWKYRAVSLPKGWQPNAVDVQEIFAQPTHARAHPLLACFSEFGSHTGLRFFARSLVPVHQSQSTPSPYRPHGTYVVIGGAGDLGVKWSEHVIVGSSAQVIWIGRRSLDGKISAEIERLSELGPKPVYISADATDVGAMDAAKTQIVKRFGPIHGVVHSALHFEETDISSLSADTFMMGFNAKAKVSDAIETVFGNLPLDFILMFSSVVSLIRNPRQASYAAGCAYNDAMAQQLEQRLAFPVKTMNWGYWSSTKVQPADASAHQAFLRLNKIGIGLIDADEGMQALELLLSSSEQQVGLVKTIKPVDIEGLSRTTQLTLPAPVRLDYSSFPSVQLDNDVAALSQASDIPELDTHLLTLLQVQLDAVGARKLEFQAPLGHLKLWLKKTLALLSAREEQTSANAWSQWQTFRAKWIDDPSRIARLNLVEAGLKGLPDILIGKRQPTDILFPNADLSLVENVHKHNPVAQAFHIATAQTVLTACTAVNSSNDSRGLRLLEVGAGTGSTTTEVLNALRTEPSLKIDTYHYTDLSAAFLAHGRVEHDAPFVAFDRLDISNCVEQQGFESQSYDMIICGNVLHATADIGKTLGNAKALLKPGGYLIGCEVTQNALFTHLTFGLLEGWWAVEDPHIRLPDCPGLNSEGWRIALTLAGFCNVGFPASHMHSLGQQIFVTQSDGVLHDMMPKTIVGMPQDPLPTRDTPSMQAPPLTPHSSTHTGPSDIHRIQLGRFLCEVIGDSLGMAAHDLDSNHSLDDYGMDSILAVALTDNLNKDFDNISSTFVFDYRTVNQIRDFLLETQAPAVSRLFPILQDNTPAVKTVAATPTLTKARVEHTAPATLAAKIAIVGLSCRVPGAATAEDFWNNIETGQAAIQPMPSARYDVTQFEIFKGTAEGLHTLGGYIEDIDQFDPLAFGISKAEARWIDPRQRLFLQEALHAFEDAGVANAALRGSNCGIFVGVEEGEYGFITEGRGQIGSNQIASIAARIAYFLDLSGPNFALSAACSSGLLAVHQAGQALRNSECDMALAGGVSLVLSPITHLGLAHGKMLGRKHPAPVFSPDASGIVPGDAIAAIVLKRYDDAVRDGNTIHGILAASAVNYDGKTLGMASPSPARQAQLIEKVLDKANLDPSQVQMVMAHSVGSALTDKIEYEAVSKALKNSQQGVQITSIKPLVGHSFAASGVVSLVAAIMAMQNRKIPAIHGLQHSDIQQPNSQITIAKSSQSWETQSGELRRALIGTTGLSGTNVQVVLEEPILETKPNAFDHAQSHLFVFSGRDTEALGRVLLNFGSAVSGVQLNSLRDIAYTLQTGRMPMQVRAAFTANCIQDLQRLVNEALSFVLKPTQNQPEWLSLSSTEQNKSKTLSNLLSGPAGQNFINALVKERALARLGALWCEGFDITWDYLYSDARPISIRLPGYPFATESYWVPTTSQEPEERQSSLKANQSVSLAETDSRYTISDQNIASTIREFMATQLALTDHEVSDTCAWHDYGADSIFETRLLILLEERYGVKLSGRELVETPNVRGLADHISKLIIANGFTDDSSPHGAEECCPLSVGQQGIWWDQMTDPQSTGYNVPIAFTVKGALQHAAFEQALKALLAQYPFLQCVIAQDHETGRPLFTPQTQMPIAVRYREAPECFDDLLAEMCSRTQTPFQLETVPPFSTTVWTGSETTVLLLFHHVVIDGISTVVFMAQLWEAYQRATRGEALILHSTDSGSMRDFVAWEDAMLQDDRAIAHQKFWASQLDGLTPPTPPIGDRTEVTKTQPGIGQMLDYHLPKELTQDLVRAARQGRGHLNTLFLLGYQLLLSRIARCDDVVIGLTAQVRPETRFEKSVGYFVNVLPLRSKIDLNQTAVEAIQSLRTSVQDCLDHAAYPFAKIMSTQPHAHSTIMHGQFSFQNFVPKGTNSASNLGSLEIETHDGVTQLGEPGLSLEVMKTGETYRLRFKFLKEEWSSETIWQLAEMMCQHLKALISSPSQTLGKILLDAHYIAASPPLPPAEDIMHHFARMALNTPHAPALIETDNDTKPLSYSRLARQVDAFAANLMRRGLKPGSVAAVHMPRSRQSIVALLGCMRVGITYLPLALDDPETRKKQILSRGSASIIVCDAASKPTLNALCDVPTLVLNPSSRAKLTTVPIPDPDGCAYMLFTSGTTGTPKAVKIARHSLNAHIKAMSEELHCTPTDRVLQFTPLHLDPSLEQIFSALTTGAFLVMRGPELWTAQTFWSQIGQHRLSICDITPSYLKELMLSPPTVCPEELRLMVVGGEAMPTELAVEWRQSTLGQVALLNAYGLTEATITSAIYRLEPKASLPQTRALPIGHAIMGETLIILDHHQRLMPNGTIGEIAIGGVGLAQGYVSASERDQSRFVSLPLSKNSKKALWYRTGDLGRVLPSENGAIECLTREDAQIQLRGMRIELDEIKSALVSHSHVKDATLSSQTDHTGEQELQAKVRLGAGSDPTTFLSEIRSYLTNLLPAHMLPGQITVEDYDSNQRPRQQQRATSELEKIWARILGQAPADATQDFFLAGGHSLLALRLLSQVETLLGIKIPISQFVLDPTLAGLHRLCAGVSSDSTLRLPLSNVRPWFIMPPGVPQALLRQFQASSSTFTCLCHEFDGNPANIPEMAKSYTETIMSKQRTGPVILGGWSFGGILALETAQQLKIQHRDVENLVLVETYHPQLLRSYEHESYFQKHWDAIIGEAPQTEQEAAYFAQNQLIYAHQSEALNRYEPSVYGGKTTIVRAQDELNRLTDPMAGFTDTLIGTTVRKTLDYDHYEVLLDPQNITKLESYMQR
ncbi:amino acid adenylation domain-containing protein [Pseudopelagicola sp. nBUS_19]|uniref:amino acid adenylation domain-containing protein n=1 Tax=Pseudopelagicola sp. nBUS_19 TaxID=3395316 RepID=UPI003EBB9EA6